MSDRDSQRTKLYTVESANRALPLVSAIVSDIVRLSGDLSERQDRLTHLTAGRQIDAGDPYGQELAQIQSQLEIDKNRLSDFTRELTELGVELKDARRGVCDFPALLDGELVYLCWKVDEPEVSHWHGLDDGFDDRKPLEPAGVSS
jgi:hypothetical protein